VIGRREIFVGILGTLLLAPVSEAQQPAATGAPKFVTPFKGEAPVQILNPQQKQEGNLMVTRIKVKNVANLPLIGFKADEYWYSAKGEAVSGSPTFRHPKPFMPGEVIEVVLRSPFNAQMSRNLRVFAHQNGKVKATLVPKLKADS
jgi:hypothetical protein